MAFVFMAEINGGDPNHLVAGMILQVLVFFWGGEWVGCVCTSMGEMMMMMMMMD